MSSLTSPNDRNKNPLKLERNVPPLEGDEFQNALSDLSDNNFLKKYPRLERVFADPAIPNQQFCLCSFVPSKNAVPDKDGIYGMIKFRGAYNTLDELNERAEFLIQNVDSYHKIYHCYTGKPFPATSSSKFSAETSEVDIRKKVTKVISDDIRQQKMEERKEIEEIKAREKRLLDESKEDFEEDPLDKYITTRVKKAQLVWTYLETKKKMDQMQENIIKARAEVNNMDEQNPEFISKYKDKYYAARNKAGLKQENDDSFMKYLGDDIDDAELLGF
jgi:hypothetical protein